MSVGVVSLMSTKSAVGRVTAETWGGQYALADTMIFALDRGPYHDTTVPTVPIRSLEHLSKMLSVANVPVYVLSDNSSNAIALQASWILPGLAVVHDVNLWHAAIPALLGQTSGSAQPHAADLLGFSDRLPESLRGPESVTSVRRSGPNDMNHRPSLLPVALAGAAAALTHSAWAAASLAPYCVGPVLHTPLPRGGVASGGRDPEDVSASHLGGSGFAITVGHVNSNRLIGEIIQTLREMRHLGIDLPLIVAGPISAPMHEWITREAGGRDPIQVTLTGYLSEDALRAMVSSASLAFVLRDPVLEASSASLLYCLSLGVPVAILSHAHYAEVSSDAAIHLAPDGAPRSWAQAISTVITNGDARRHMDREAGRFLAGLPDGRDYMQTASSVVALAAGRIALKVALRRAGVAWGELSHDIVSAEDPALPEMLARNFSPPVEVS